MRINYRGESKILKSICTEVNRLSEDIGTISRMTGDMEKLATTDKSSIVAAVNEVVGLVDGILEGES